MPRPKDAKVWNEELISALQYREDLARRQGKRSIYTYAAGWKAIEEVREDIYAFRNGRIVNLPSTKLSKTVDNLCRDIIAGTVDVIPKGYVGAATEIQGNPYTNDPYLNKIKKRGGAYAILLAFHLSTSSVLTKAQICKTAQHFCDEEMEENYFAGRSRGAWAANKTLISHNLMIVNKTVGYNERAGGMRSRGPWTYALTENGKQFVEALLEKNPDIQNQIDAVRGNLPQQNEQIFTNNYFAAAPNHHFAAAATRPIIHRSPPRRPPTENSAKDEQELRDWVQTAEIGHVKEFKVGKDRRKRLHDICDELNAILHDRGLRHESDGTNRSRSLFVTMIRKNQNDFVPNNVSSSFPVKTSPPRPAGRTLDESPASKVARLAVPARLAAANAAFERQAMRESLMLPTSSRPTVTPTTTPLLVDLVNEDDDGDRKLPAKNIGANNMNNPYKSSKSKPEVLEIDSDSSDDELPDNVFFKCPPSKPDHRNNATKISNPYKVANTKIRSSCRKELDFDTDDALPEITSNHRIKTDILDSKPAAKPKLAIKIDDRERNRDRTPRTLRLELTRLLSTGLLSMVWPKQLLNASVEERRLDSGDFAFRLTQGSEEFSLPVSVERKRVGDLVQRSNQKDHWYQLQRMQDEQENGICVFLFEGDCRTAVQYTPYGAQEVETISPYDHTIDDEESLYRFIGRAILNDRTHSTRFVQSKDEQGSLRAVGAIGLMSATSFRRREGVTVARINSKAERICLKDRLQKGGIPWELAVRIGDEMKSVKQMDLLYASVEDENCRDRLFIPVVADLCSQLKLAGTSLGWSTAIHRVWYSVLENPGTGRDRFDQLCHLVEDHALLLTKLHTGLSAEESLDQLLNTRQLVADDLSRFVLVEAPAEYRDCFPSECEGKTSFFHLQVSESSQKIPTIIMQTVAGPYHSSRLYLHLVDGVDIIRRLNDAFANNDTDCLVVAREVAVQLKLDFSAVAKNTVDDDRIIVLIRGINNALDQAAKKIDFRSEMRVLVDMIQAELMIEHEIIVLHALRLSIDKEIIIQQLALACYHFQLLTKKED